MDRYRIVHVVTSLLGALVLLGLLFLLLSTQGTLLAASQASIVVDTLDDELNIDGDCSLREAIQAASTDAPVDACPAGSTVTDTITFSSGGTILLTDPLLVFPSDPLEIDGGETITLSGNRHVRIFAVYAGADLTLRNLSLVDGYNGALGGGIYNYGALSIENSTLSGNHVDGDGGAIHNSGTLYVHDSTISDNRASYSGYYECNGYGGGIYNSAGSRLYVSNTQFLRNDAGNEGGGIYNAGEADVRGSSFSGAHACTAAGISTGITNTAVLYLSDSVIYDNHAVWQAGPDFAGQGGGIMYWGGSATITNTTISANLADMIGGGLSGFDQGTDSLMFTNSTLYGNTATSSPAGGNIYIWSYSTLIFRNSIIAGGYGSSNCYIGPSAIIIDGGYNIEDGHTCGFSPANGSMPDTDPVLDSLQDNGGPTWTQALLAGSPAIDGANPDPAYCPPADQRGIARPIDGDGNGEATCDIGSFESRQPTMTTITSDQPDPSRVGAPFTTTFSVTTTFGLPTGMVIVDGGKGTCSGELFEGNGSCQMTLTGSGTYTLTATYSGDGVYEISHATEIHVVTASKMYLPLINKP
jgi:CSLREA domain-containing protein